MAYIVQRIKYADFAQTLLQLLINQHTIRCTIYAVRYTSIKTKFQNLSKMAMES